MSAQSLQVYALDIPNPEWAQPNSGSDPTRINSNVSWSFITSFDLQTLSTSNSISSGRDVTGLLYVPDLKVDDPCFNASAPYVPANVTRKANLPENEFYLMAIAPWISPDCTLQYFTAVKHDPLAGFIFFLPGNSSDTPPDPGDPAWNTGDGGQWKQQNNFPVYAVPSSNGRDLMQASARYSGNVTDVYLGHELIELGYDPRDYIRLYADINTGSGGALPSLWVFLLIVLGILLFIIGFTSLAMHWLQRRRRQSLRRRVANGEVDLEALGIKRLTVPQSILNKMPLYPYGVASSTPSPTKAHDAVRPGSPTSTARPSAALLRSSSYHPTPLSQPTCAICLDDFVLGTAESEGTMVRELPCRHVFHPECVDTFLRDNSSLCPMCKKTALPRGYCPRVVTNAMVRRERMVRRIQERMANDPDAGERMAGELDGPGAMSLGRRIRTRTFSGLSQFSVGGRRVFSTPPTQQMSQLTPAPPSSQRPPLGRSTSETSASQPPGQNASAVSRREWARERAVAMLGRRAPEDPDAEEAQVTPRWRKAMRGIFPGLGRG